jgi:hypothetical protein
MKNNWSYLKIHIFFIFCCFKILTPQNTGFINKTFCQNPNIKTWKCDIISENKFRNIYSNEAVEYLGLIEHSKITETFSSKNESYLKIKDEEFDAREKWPICVDYIEDQCDCIASPAFAITHTLSDRLCILKNGKKPYKMSIHSIEYGYLILDFPKVIDLIACDFMSYNCKGQRTENMIYRMVNFGITYAFCQQAKFFSRNHRVECRKVCDDEVSQPEYVKILAESIQIIKDPEMIKSDIITKGPVYAEMTVYEDFYYYKSGIYENVTTNLIGYHSVRVSFIKLLEFFKKMTILI